MLITRCNEKDIESVDQSLIFDQSLGGFGFSPWGPDAATVLGTCLWHSHHPGLVAEPHGGWENITELSRGDVLTIEIH